jgi:hypothetical protein
VGGHLDPVALVLGAGSKLITNPLTSPFFPGVTGLPSRSRGREGTPVSTANSACFQHGHCWSASPGSLPRRNSGRARGQEPR